MSKKQLHYKTYYDKVLGGWIGKCAGGILGAPIEGFKCFNEIELSDKLFETNFSNDDLDLQILWLDMVKQKGAFVNEFDLKEHWVKHVKFPWGEYGIASRNFSLGLDIPDSGKHNNHYWYRGMGSPIRSEIWGMLNPGNPTKAMHFAKIDSELDHEGFSVEAEMFLSAAASIAFFEHDINNILKETAALFPTNSEIANLVNTVWNWYNEFDKKIVAGKIKSRYGDADFTSAPQNIAFTLLALLQSANSMDSIMDALHYGHDSDCVVATAGALLGIVNGYQQIPESWKERVGNELLVSPEIVGIEHTDTVSGLAEETCKAGLSFIDAFGEVELIETNVKPYNTTLDEVTITTSVVEFPLAGKWNEGTLDVQLTNRGTSVLKGNLKLISPHFETEQITCAIPASNAVSKSFQLKWKEEDYAWIGLTNFPYNISFEIEEGKKWQIDRGVPSYGSWKLIGPFIQDDKELVPMHATYPDHGLDSLPSFNYMNRDKLNLDTDFIDIQEIIKLKKQGKLNAQSYELQTINPEGFKIDLSKYYTGRGERSIYLYSTLESKAVQSKWLTMGCNAFFKVFMDEQILYKSDKIIRSWPYAHFFKLDLKQGINHLLIKIDTPSDLFDFEIGLKEFEGKHPHQSMWETDMIFKAE